MEYTCLPGGFTGTGNDDLDGSTAELGAPFVWLSDGRRLLSQLDAGETFTGACVDAGNDLVADANLPDWTLRSTRTDLVVDATPVDCGHHSSPADTFVLSLSAEAFDPTCTTQGASWCEVTNDADLTTIEVPTANLASGSLPHGQVSGTLLTLTSLGASSPAVTRAMVP